MYIFRNPTRITPILSGANKNNLIISPADGKVIEISEITPNEEIGLPEGKWKRVCVFMNVFDVHVTDHQCWVKQRIKNIFQGLF